MTHNDFVRNVLTILRDVGNSRNDVETAIHLCLKNIELTEGSTELVTVDKEKRGSILNKFLACKMVEGCTEKTLYYYKKEMEKFMLIVPKQVEQINVDDIRYYLAVRKSRDKVNKTTMNNNLHVLRSFFGWAAANDVIVKDPTLTIKKIKSESRVKKPFSDEEQERLRIAAQGDVRQIAIIELFLSTGIRVGELVGLNRSDLNNDEATVFGKGEKERIVFLNARARVALKIYLDSRDDDNDALFVSSDHRHRRLGIARVEKLMSNLSKASGISDVHPHRFRRTAATMALRRGMPIEQVQKMLGHSQIATTLIYAESSMDTVKSTHQRLM